MGADLSNRTISAVEESNADRIAQEQAFLDQIQEVAQNMAATAADQQSQLESQQDIEASLQEQTSASFLQLRPNA